MATVQCAVIKGDLPVEIVWSLNGRPIVVSAEPGDPYHRDIVIRRSGKRASTLTIDSVAARHAGVYSCSASNPAGTAEHAADLSVNGTPFSFLSTSSGVKKNVRLFPKAGLAGNDCMPIR